MIYHCETHKMICDNFCWKCRINELESLLHEAGIMPNWTRYMPDDNEPRKRIRRLWKQKTKDWKGRDREVHVMLNTDNGKDDVTISVYFERGNVVTQFSVTREFLSEAIQPGNN